MRAAVALGLCALAGCYNPSPPQGAPCTDDDHCPSSQKCVGGFCGGAIGTDGGGTADTMPDSPSLPLCQQWTPKHFDACMIPAPTGDMDLGVALSGYNLDTNTGEMKGKMGTVIPT